MVTLWPSPFRLMTKPRAPRGSIGDEHHRRTLAGTSIMAAASNPRSVDNVARRHIMLKTRPA